LRTILHITTQLEWQAAQAAGHYEAPSLQSEGFIHFSTAEQIVRVANAFYGGQTDLVMLVVDPDRLSAELRWEDPAHRGVSMATGQSEIFPHLYGPLNLDAVLRAVPFPANSDGTFHLPEDLSV
jgi:uncharacterized protein (DUF952 family)